MFGFNTVSNIMFTPLQFATADIMSIPHIAIVALQNQGGAIGNMVCINNIVAFCATTGIVGAEGKILKTTIGPWFIYYLILIGVMVTLMSIGFVSSLGA